MSDHVLGFDYGKIKSKSTSWGFNSLGKCNKHLNTWGAGISSTDSYEAITYACRGKWNPCLHLKTRSNNFSTTVDYVNEYGCPCSSNHVGVPTDDQMINHVADLGSVASQSILHRLFDRIQGKLRGYAGLEEGVNLINFIRELKDFSEPVDKFKSAFKSYKDLMRSLHGTVTQTDREVGAIKALVQALIYDRNHGLCRNISQKVLEVNFAYLPFISDVRSMIRSVVEVDDRLRDLKLLAKHEYLSTSATFKPTSGMKPVTDEFMGTDADSVNRHKFVSEMTNQEYKLRLRYKLKLPQISDSEARKKLLLDGFGLGKNQLATLLEVAWEAIPFSFVADYFIKIGDFIAQFEEPQYAFTLEPLAGCLQIKKSGTVKYYHGICWPWNGSWCNRKITFWKLYHRVIDIIPALNNAKDYISLQWGTGLSKVRILNLLAVLGTKTT